MWVIVNIAMASSRSPTDLLVAGCPLALQVAVPRYRFTTMDCGRVCSVRDLRSWPAAVGDWPLRSAYVAAVYDRLSYDFGDSPPVKVGWPR
jgi:hypothetical protein